MKITFEGIPPFSLDTVQNATAQAVSENVEMTLYVLAEGKNLVPLHVPMTRATAQTLSSKLAAAAIQADQNARK